MTWKLIETIEQEVKVELEGGHTAVLRPLTPTELRHADASVAPLDAFTVRVVQGLAKVAESGEDRAPTEDERNGLAVFHAWLTDRNIARLELALVSLDGAPVKSFKAMLERIRPVTEALSLVNELGAHLERILSLPDEGKD